MLRRVAGQAEQAAKIFASVIAFVAIQQWRKIATIIRLQRGENMLKPRWKSKRMSASKKQTKLNVNLRHPQVYHYSCMANRFAIQREDGFLLAHFGLVSKKDVLLDRLTCLFPESTLSSLKENLVAYSEGIGLPKSKIPAWPAPTWIESNFKILPVVDFVHLCNWNDAFAEICFWNYSQAFAADTAKMGEKKGDIHPWGIALLRCDLDLQRAFLEELYET